jgi:hypothetical protein
MAQTPVITHPAHGTTAVGQTPQLRGMAHPGYSVSILESNKPEVALAGGVADSNGNWVIDVPLPRTDWISLQAICYSGGDQSGWSAPITISAS